MLAFAVWDPQIDVAEARGELKLDVQETAPPPASYDAVVLAVGHREVAGLGAEKIRSFGRPGAVVFDVKGVFAKHETDGRL